MDSFTSLSGIHFVRHSTNQKKYRIWIPAGKGRHKLICEFCNLWAHLKAQSLLIASRNVSTAFLTVLFIRSGLLMKRCYLKHNALIGALLLVRL